MKKIHFFGIGDGGCNIAEKIKNKGQIDAKFYGMNVSRDSYIKHDLMTCKISRKDDKAVYKIITKEYNLQNASQLVLVSCLGSDATSYLVPNIVRIAEENNIPVISIVTLPFDFEGEIINQKAINTLNELKKYSEPTLVIKNDNFKNKIQKNNFDEVFNEINEYIANLLVYENEKIIFKTPEIINIVETTNDNKNLIYLLNYNLSELAEVFEDKFSENKSFRMSLLTAILYLWKDNSFTHFYKTETTKKVITLFRDEIPILIEEINQVFANDRNSYLLEYLWSHSIQLLLLFLKEFSDKI